MVVHDVDSKLLEELESMDFPIRKDLKQFNISGLKVVEQIDVSKVSARSMAHSRFRLLMLRYGPDLRLNEAQLWQVAQRTTALPIGRGAFTISTTCTMLTEGLEG
ncbi:hypothetical protein Tco_1570321, partial [Tanacetum coccineum]